LTDSRSVMRLCHATKLGYFLSTSWSAHTSVRKPWTTKSQGMKHRSAYVLR